MDEELRNSIAQLNESIVDLSRQVARQNRMANSSTSSPNRIQTPYGPQREEFDDFNTRLATPMLPGGFRAFFGGATGVRFIKKVFAEATRIGYIKAFKRTFGQSFDYSSAIGTQENFEERADLLKRARLGELTEEEKTKEPELAELKDIFQETPEFQKIQEKVDEQKENRNTAFEKLREELADGRRLWKSKAKKSETVAQFESLQKLLEEEDPNVEKISGSIDTLLTRLTPLLGPMAGNTLPGGAKGQPEIIQELVDNLEAYNDQLQTASSGLATHSNEQAELAETQSIEQAKREGINNVMALFGKRMTVLAGTVLVVTTALIAARRALMGLQEGLGGVGLREAISRGLSTIPQALQSIGPGGQTFVTPGEMIQAMGSAQREFGVEITADQAAQLAGGAVRTGIGDVGSYVQLQRVFQGIDESVGSALDQFEDVDIGSQLAADELNQVPDAVARAGSKFNTFIVQGIKNAKRLGLEFSKIESTLTGFSTDFEGTVSSFSELRAVIPGFEVDFNELMYTSLYGTTDEFIEQIRSGLMGAGITSIEGMSRTAVSALEQATGFRGDEIERILVGGSLDGAATSPQDIMNDLLNDQIDQDAKRNTTLDEILESLKTFGGSIMDLVKDFNLENLKKVGMAGFDLVVSVLTSVGTSIVLAITTLGLVLASAVGARRAVSRVGDFARLAASRVGSGAITSTVAPNAGAVLMDGVLNNADEISSRPPTPAPRRGILSRAGTAVRGAGSSLLGAGSSLVAAGGTSVAAAGAGSIGATVLGGLAAGLAVGEGVNKLMGWYSITDMLRDRKTIGEIEQRDVARDERNEQMARERGFDSWEALQESNRLRQQAPVVPQEPMGSRLAENTESDTDSVEDREAENRSQQQLAELTNKLDELKTVTAEMRALKTVWERGITAEMRGVDRVILSIQDADRRGVNA